MWTDHACLITLGQCVGNIIQYKHQGSLWPDDTSGRVLKDGKNREMHSATYHGFGDTKIP